MWGIRNLDNMKIIKINLFSGIIFLIIFLVLLVFFFVFFFWIAVALFFVSLIISLSGGVMGFLKRKNVKKDYIDVKFKVK
jgi:hypothetical protein